MTDMQAFERLDRLQEIARDLKFAAEWHAWGCRALAEAAVRKAIEELQAVLS